MNSISKNTENRQLLQQHREHVLEYLKDLDAQLKEWSDSELTWLDNHLLKQSDASA
jgi:hypothetical protein